MSIIPVKPETHKSGDNADSVEARAQAGAEQHRPLVMPTPPGNFPTLTNRQAEIGAFVAKGYSNRDIATELDLTEQIVKNVVHSLFDKLGVWNRVELANYFSGSSDAQKSALRRIEQDRVSELHRQKILDTSAERIFDELAWLAANLFTVPIALVAFADSDRIWFKSCIGLNASEVPREITICHHTIQQSRVFVVSDALQDARFMCSPLVTVEPKVRFYAAAPILTEDGYALGVVCIVDRIPRQLTDAQLAILQSLARLAAEQLAMRTQLREQNLAANSMQT